MTLSSEIYMYNVTKGNFNHNKLPFVYTIVNSLFWCIFWCDFLYSLFKTLYLRHLTNNFHDEASHGKAFEGLLARYFG